MNSTPQNGMFYLLMNQIMRYLNSFHHRLSLVTEAKSTPGNAAKTDLGNTDCPKKFAETFLELYENAWADAFKELDNTLHNEEETINVLLQIFKVELLQFDFKD